MCAGEVPPRPSCRGCRESLRRGYPPPPAACCSSPLLACSHVVVGKGGKLLDVQNGISPGDSFEKAAEFCAANKQA